MHHVDKYGIGKVVEMALEHVGKNRPIHLSFDVGTSLVVLFLPSTNALLLIRRMFGRCAGPDCCAQHRHGRESLSATLSDTRMRTLMPSFSGSRWPLLP